MDNPNAKKDLEPAKKKQSKVTKLHIDNFDHLFKPTEATLKETIKAAAGINRRKEKKLVSSKDDSSKKHHRKKQKNKEADNQSNSDDEADASSGEENEKEG